jgi:exoribonuclease-2
LVEIDSPLDQEARKRASSVYLPTRTITMFPDALGCGTASLQHGQTRAALRTSVWCNDEGEVVRFELSRELIRVERRLDYRQVDALLANGTPGDPLVKELSLLATLARARRERRKSAGALFIRRDEWKLKVDQEQRIEVSPIVGFSQSRSLVAEMMILANELAAKKAQQGGIPLLYRVQDAPAATLPKIDENDPNALSKLRGMIKPAHQSLHLGAHWGLGVSGYAQVTSPLRRYGDLVLQRQLAASIDGQTPPYDNDELLAVMATIEATELAGKRLESAVQQRWALEYVAQHRDERHPALVMSDTRSGFKVQLQSCGAEGLLPTRASLELGSMIEVAIEQVRPRQGSLRVAL